MVFRANSALEIIDTSYEICMRQDESSRGGGKY
jgi:hypothetical protein